MIDLTSGFFSPKTRKPQKFWVKNCIGPMVSIFENLSVIIYGNFWKCQKKQWPMAYPFFSKTRNLNLSVRIYRDFFFLHFFAFFRHFWLKMVIFDDFEHFYGFWGFWGFWKIVKSAKNPKNGQFWWFLKFLKNTHFRDFCSFLHYI